MHETGPPSIPVPGEAPCAAASITAPTDDSTDALHTADDDEPDGMLNITVDVSTTVVGGMDDTDGLGDTVTEGDTLSVTVMLVDGEVDADDAELALTEPLNEGDSITEPLTVCDRVTDDVSVADTLLITLDDTDDDELTDEVALRLEDTLGDGDVE